jgi:CRISPR-associated protein Cas6
MKKIVETQKEPFYDLRYSLMGHSMPKRWHYPFFASLCSLLDDHPHPVIGIRLSGGIMPIQGKLHITPETSIVIRCPASSMPTFAQLVGKQLEVAGSKVRLGSFRVFTINPSQNLYSRMVTIANGEEPDVFKKQCETQLAEMGVSGKVTMPCYTAGVQAGGPQRRLLEIKGAKIVGFTVIVSDLSDEDSILLQTNGLGGRHHMGCGIFTHPKRSDR